MGLSEGFKGGTGGLNGFQGISEDISVGFGVFSTTVRGVTGRYRRSFVGFQERYSFRSEVSGGNPAGFGWL